jgi:hypothetical protein
MEKYALKILIEKQSPIRARERFPHRQIRMSTTRRRKTSQARISPKFELKHPLPTYQDHKGSLTPDRLHVSATSMRGDVMSVALQSRFYWLGV